MKTLYDVTVTFDPASVAFPVESAAIRGEFLFYHSNMTGNTDETGMVENDPKYPPSAYEDGMDPIGGLYFEEMTKNADGVYEISFRLPAGVYPYSFVLNPEIEDLSENVDPRFGWAAMLTKDGTKKMFTHFEDAIKCGFKGEKNHVITDPENAPYAPTVTGTQMNSELYVGTPAECKWLPIEDESKQGTVTYLSYKDIDGKYQSLAVYLPADYSREKTYPLILVSHGGGGNEADWPSQGSIGNIMDNLIAEGKTREAILVCPNHTVYQWDFAKIAENAEKCVIPFIEKLFPVSREVKDRAFCGLSMGSMTTLYMYMHRAEVYDYFGAFSGGIAPGHPAFTVDDPHLADVKLLIGCAEEDIAYNEREIGVPPTIRALKAKGLPYIPYFVPGSHDWFCWPQMFTYFASEVLWK